MARPSAEQWQKLLDLLAADKELLHGEFLAAGGVIRTQQKWDAIALQVNAVPGATAEKTGEQWKMAYVGVRSRARRSCREMAHYRQGTGGGPDVVVAGLGLSALHERIINLTGLTAATGTKCPDPLKIQLEQLHLNEEVAEEYNDFLDPFIDLNEEIHIPNADDLLDEFVGAGDDDLAPGAAAEAPLLQAAAVANPVAQHAAHVKVEHAAAKPEINVSQFDLSSLNVRKMSEEASCSIHALSSDDEDFKPAALSVVVKNEPTVETECITLDDTPVDKMKQGKGKLIHTPPSRGTGFTPQCKKRLNLCSDSNKPEDLKKDKQEAMAKEDCADLRVLVKNNTAAMEQLYRELRRFRL